MKHLPFFTKSAVLSYVVLIVVGSASISCKKKSEKQTSNAASTSAVANPSERVVKTNSDLSGFKKVLLEEYTGHTCGNCPRAAEEASKIVSLYGNKVVVLANHVSETFSSPKKDYPEDFRNSSSTKWDGFFGISASGLPKGMINRVNSPPYPVNFPGWKQVIDTELLKTQSIKIDVSSTYYPQKKKLYLSVTSTFFQTFSDSIYLLVVLTQDSVIASQTDYTPPSGVLVLGNNRRPDYRFDHVVVNALNGDWGQELSDGNNPINQKVSRDFEFNLGEKCFAESNCINDKNMNVVVFAYNSKTKEVLQVEKLKIR